MKARSARRHRERVARLSPKNRRSSCRLHSVAPEALQQKTQRNEQLGKIVRPARALRGVPLTIRAEGVHDESVHSEPSPVQGVCLPRAV